MGDRLGGANQRAERRSNMFIAAALFPSAAGTDPLAVRLRNLSPWGALVEGFDLPDAGSAVRLVRGSLAASGTVMWNDATRAGLCFDRPITVFDWLPGTQRRGGQQEVDRMLFELRAAAPGPSGAPAPSPSLPDYREIGAALAAAAEALLADPGVAERHVGALQAIDIAAQALRHAAGDQ